MVLGVLLLRDSGFDHFGDAAGGKQEDEDYGQVFHGSVLSARRGESQWATERESLSRFADETGITKTKERH